MQLQESLNVVYNTLESTIKAMDNVPQLMTEFSGALGSFPSSSWKPICSSPSPARC